MVSPIITATFYQLTFTLPSKSIASKKTKINSEFIANQMPAIIKAAIAAIAAKRIRPHKITKIAQIISLMGWP
jgi:hypothetical protein